MANVDHMMAAGLPAEAAKSIVGTIENGVTATGSSQSDAYAIKADVTFFSTVASSTGAIIPSALPVHSEIRVFNGGASNMSLYPPSGCTINDASANVAVIVPAGEGALITRVSSTVFGCSGCSDLTATELEFLDGATAGTQVASKAVIADTNVNIGIVKCTQLHIGTSGSETQVTATGAELNYNDIATLGTGAASKAVVLDAGEDYTWPATGILTYGVLKDSAATTITATGAEINYLDIATLGTGAASKAVVLDAGEDYTWPATGVLTYGGTGITATGAEINYLDIATLGTGAASKAVVLDAGEDYTWPATGVLTYGGTGITATGAEINYLDIATLGTGAASKAVVLDAGEDYTWPATGVLTYGGTGITATGAEINYLDITTLGTGAASKAVVLDAGEDYTWPATGILTYGVLKDSVGTTIGATGAEINAIADVSARVQELTVSGAVTAGVTMVELNHVSTAIAATIANSALHAGVPFTVKDTSASGTAAHTVTLTAGTWDGTNNIATFNAPGEQLVVVFGSDGNGLVILNTGTVGLSS